MSNNSVPQLDLFPKPVELINSKRKQLLTDRRVSDKLEKEIIAAIASVDVEALEKLISENIKLYVYKEVDRNTFFNMLRSKFQELRGKGKNKYQVSNSICQNCSKNKRVTVFTESGRYKNGFALAFERKDNLITSISECQYYGIKRDDMEEASHRIFSYFTGN